MVHLEHMYLIQSKGTYQLSGLVGWVGQSANVMHQFCQTESAAHDQTGHPPRTRSINGQKQLSVWQNGHIPQVNWLIQLASSDKW